MKIQTSRQFFARLATRRFSRLLAASSAGIISSLALLATTPDALADVTKADNTTALNLAASYTPAGLPTTTDRIIFDNTIVTAANNNAALGGDLSIAGIVFGTTTSLTSTTYTINNTVGATLTLGGSGISLTSTVDNFNINDAVKLGASQAWDVVSGRTLTLAGGSGATLDLGANVLTVQNAGATTLTSLIYGSGSIARAATTGTLTLNAATGSGNTGNAGNLFSGGITVGAGGTVAISTANASGTGLITSSGTLNISAAQYLLSGGITVNAGTTTLSAVNAAGTGTVTLSGGTLALTNNTAAQLASVVLSSGTFAPANAVTLGSLAGTQGFTQTANAISLGTNNTSATYSGNIAGAVASNLTKTGSGTQILNGTDATTGSITANGSGGALEIGGQFTGNGAVVVNSGTLRLNFGTNNVVTSNLVNAGALTLGGGTLAVVGQTGATNVTQSFGGLTTTAGTASNVTVTNGGGSTALNIGALTSRGAGTAVNFNLPSGTLSATNGVLTSQGSAGALLRSANNNAFATVNGTDFAAKDATNVFITPLTGAFTATTSSIGASTDNADIIGVSPTVGAQTINTVRFAGTAASTLTLTGALNVNSGAILVSSSVTGTGSKITGGSITAGATPAELIVHQFSSQPFTLDTPVTGAISLVKSGPGTLILTQVNTNSATSYVDSGVLRIATGGSLSSSQINLAPNDPTAVLDVSNVTTSIKGLSGGGPTGGYANLGSTGALTITGFGTFSGALVGGVGTTINLANTSSTIGLQSSSQLAFYGTINETGATSNLGVFGTAANLTNATVNMTNATSTFNTGGGFINLILGVGNLNGAGSIDGGTTANTSPFAVGVGYLGANGSFSGVIKNGTATPTANVVGFTKFGSATQTLSGNNIYTGTTQVNTGQVIFDYSGGNVPLPTGSAFNVGGGLATFLGKATGATTITTGTFGVNNTAFSQVALNANGGSGTTLTLKTAALNSIATLGSNSPNNVLLFDTSNSASNVVQTDAVVGAADTNATNAIRTQNGLLVTGASATTNYRADVLFRDSTGIGFATNNGTTTISRYTAATTLPTSGTLDTGNYKITAPTQTQTSQLLYNTLQLDSSSNSVALTTDANRFGAGSGTVSGRGVLATGTNGASITSASGTNQATFFYNFQNGATTAGQTLTLNMPLTGGAIFNGTGLTVATGLVSSSDTYFQSGVTRLTGAQGSGDALTSGPGVYRLNGGVLEIGADLTGSTSSTSTADFSRSVGSSAGQVQLLGDTGFSAFGGNRTVNLGGAGQTLVWGTDNFLASTAGGTTEGNNTFRLSSTYSDSTVDFQNGIALGSITRQVNVADGSASVDARLSGVISGVFSATNTLGNSAPALANAAAGLTKLGLGTLELTANNTYNGPTSVNAGTLLINNTPVAGVGSGTGSGTVAVNNGGTLGGTGAVSGATTVNGGGQITGATVGTIGTLTLRSNLSFVGASGNLATFLVDIGGGTNNSDKLAVGGVLDLSGTFDQITFSGSPDGTSNYVLATYSSVLGTFDVGTAPAGYSFVYNPTELDLVATAVPEPATWFGGSLMLGLAAWSQRKRFGARQKA